MLILNMLLISKHKSMKPTDLLADPNQRENGGGDGVIDRIFASLCFKGIKLSFPGCFVKLFFVVSCR